MSLREVLKIEDGEVRSRKDDVATMMAIWNSYQRYVQSAVEAGLKPITYDVWKRIYLLPSGN